MVALLSPWSADFSVVAVEGEPAVLTEQRYYNRNSMLQTMKLQMRTSDAAVAAAGGEAAEEEVAAFASEQQMQQKFADCRHHLKRPAAAAAPAAAAPAPAPAPAPAQSDSSL